MSLGELPCDFKPISWNEQTAVSIAQKTEVMLQGIVVDLLPIPLQECTDKKEKCALRLVKIGNEHLHDLIFVAGCYDYLCT